MGSNHKGEFAQVEIGGAVFRIWPESGGGQESLVPRPEVEDWVCRLLSVCHPGDLPLPVVLVGPPGTGKTSLAARVSKLLGLPFYPWSGNDSLSAEDLVSLARLKENNSVEMVLSPLASAVFKGGLCFLDDVDKCRPETLSAILPLLDGTRTLPSTLGAVEIPVSPRARFLFAANDLVAMPPFFRSRVFKLDVPYIPLDQTLEIVRASGAIADVHTVTRAFHAAWKAHAPKGRPEPSLREAFRCCRCIAKSLGKNDPDMLSQIIKAALES